MSPVEKTMETLEKKICIVAAGYPLPEEVTSEALNRLFIRARDSSNNHIVPACYLKGFLIEYLEEIAIEASRKKRNINAYAQQGYFWELKATFYLYYEAKTLIRTVSDQCSVSEFNEELKKKFREKGADWGYGSNWSESIHRFVMKSLKEDLERFVGDLSEDRDVASLPNC